MSNAEDSGKARRIRELEKQQQAALENEQATPAEPDPQETGQPASEPTKGEESTPGSETPPKEAPKADTEPQGGSALKTDEVDYKTAFRQTKSELEKERGRVKSIDGRLKAQSKELQELKRKLEYGEGTPDVVAKVKESEDYKKFAEDFGQEAADQIMGIAKHYADLTQSQREPDPPEPAVYDQYGINSYDEFVFALDSQVPGWDLKYDENSDFIEWAQSNEDPLSGETYLALLNRAAKVTFDVNTAKRIFSAFDRQVSQKPSNPSPEDYVEPASSGGDGSAQPEAPTYKESDLKAMETKFRRRKITREEFDNFNAEFSKAHNEGRVLIGQ